MKKSRKRPTKKSRKSSGKKVALLAIILFLIPVFYGIYLCTPQLQAAISSISLGTPHTPVQTQHYDNLETPLLSDSGHAQQIIRHTGYTVSYNSALRLPNWVAYELTREEARGTEKRSDRFVADPQIVGSMATNADYARSGYDKGHMAPAADMKWSRTAMKESFYFSNICPQHPELNRRKWKDLEEKIRDWGIADSAVVIVCGPIVGKSNTTIGRNKVTVPQRFFKVILSPYANPPRAIGFLFPNERSVAPLRNYAVTVDSVEQVAGMDFFSALPDDLENAIEAELAPSRWGL
ncbi:DNA/RNA non-specific endonuclease [Bacteroides sp.]